MPISDCEVRDPRIRRTRQLLQGALRTLLQRKGFEEISVQDITEEATLNRATFYDHYTDKFDLLHAWVGAGFHQLLQDRQVHYDGSCPSAASALILATCDYLAQSRAGGAECQRLDPFEPLIDAAVVAAIRRVLSGGFAPADAVPRGLQPEMLAATASWAIYGAAKEWFRTPNRPPAEEVVPLVLQLILPMLPGPAGDGPNPGSAR